VSLLTAADVKRAAGIGSVVTSDEDITIGEIVDAVDVVVARLVGPGAMPTTVRTWTGRGRYGAIVLPWAYASVSSVTVDGVVQAATTYDDETRAHMGILDGASGGQGPWAGATKVVVVATVGQPSIAADIKRAALVLARHWWQLDRQGGRGAWADENGAPVDSAVPRSVRDLLASSPNLAGVG